MKFMGSYVAVLASVAIVSVQDDKIFAEALQLQPAFLVRHKIKSEKNKSQKQRETPPPEDTVTPTATVPPPGKVFALHI